MPASWHLQIPGLITCRSTRDALGRLVPVQSQSVYKSRWERFASCFLRPQGPDCDRQVRQIENGCLRHED